MNPSEPSAFAEAHQAIGEYFCEFSRVEQEIGELVKVAYNLENNDASEAIVVALGDVAKKISLVWAASQSAKKPDGSPASEEWKSSVVAKIKRAFQCNLDRVTLAHSLLQPNKDGGSIWFA